jgi:hypothetical protein
VRRIPARHWVGLSMVQYVGRILRSHPGRARVEVHDHVDAMVGVLATMWRRRSRSYTQLGFAPIQDAGRGP